ncbi:MAG: DUF4278 domain-containing protein [Cyanobacteriota bacterium]|nr:DUF4278 domain-containing protein [Cyanobacteriota bacterium]
MQLTYRGIHYRSNSRIATQGDIAATIIETGKYRGVTLPLRRSLETRVLSPIELKYRGTSYR